MSYWQMHFAKQGQYGPENKILIYATLTVQRNEI